ncbi:putative bifunctional diguanylate cyclase/phosphodiesterase, partial [Sphingomonas bacterium]|uniref:putative bifunctional diguanylate cyclase/phosphodiesterase n=1 Tax=Sphingomonas bacterium TaxID=1895847 RepID=UPI001576B135
AGATHLAIDPAPGDLADLAEAAWRHAERDADRPATTAEPGWAGPESAVAAVSGRLSASTGGSMAMMVAMERLDIVNAAYGRHIGDQLIRMAATRIERTADDVDHGWSVSRVGGSEFLVLIDAAGPALAAATELVCRRLSAPFVVAGLAVSMGHRIATATPEVGEDGAALVERLRALVRIAGDERGGSAPEGAGTLAVDLHRAMERDEIEVVFQPQVRLDDGRIVGVEALARWEHPTLGTLGAEPLFAAAGQAGLAEVLSAHVQALALRRTAAWRGALGTLRVSINITAQDIASPAFAAAFLDRLEASGFPAGRLTVEITETGLIPDLDAATAVLARLRRAGCRVALDDFGTGYSSLAYLKRLPVDCLKIDRAITRDVTGSDRDRAVLAGVIGIAGALGIATIAEGVETADERDRLALMGCDLYQGFLCAGPIDATALETLVDARCPAG